MARETWVQSQVESYQRLKKWYLIPPCLTLSIIRYGSRVKWSNPGKGVAPSPTSWCSSYRKGSLRVTLNCGRQLYLLLYEERSEKNFYIEFMHLEKVWIKLFSLQQWVNSRADWALKLYGNRYRRTKASKCLAQNLLTIWKIEQFWN